MHVCVRERHSRIIMFCLLSIPHTTKRLNDCAHLHPVVHVDFTLLSNTQDGNIVGTSTAGFRNDGTLDVTGSVHWLEMQPSEFGPAFTISSTGSLTKTTGAITHIEVRERVARNFRMRTRLLIM